MPISKHIAKNKYLNTDQMMALEKHALENYPISLGEMMQNAGRAVFDVVMNEIIKTAGQDNYPGPQVCIVIGKGNNGGDALVTARLLHEKGIEVTVLSPYPDEEFSEMAQSELEKIEKMNIEIRRCEIDFAPAEYSLIIDALFGFSLKGNPRPPADKIIEQILYSSFGSAQDKQISVLSVDVPSGLDVHDGSIGQPTIKADYTVALGMPKIGFEEHPDIVGKVYLGDLGILKQAYKDMGYEPPLFRGASYIPVN